MGPRSSVCLSLKCKYIAFGWVLGPVRVLIWNTCIARWGPMSNVCFGFGMQVLQGWVSCTVCASVLECKYYKVGSMYNMCFGFGMSILQGWVPCPLWINYVSID